MNEKFLLFNADSYQKITNFIAEGLQVDHIITDPPYNISKANNFSTMKNPRSGVDFGDWDKGKFDLFSWIPLYSTLVRANGSMIIFCSYRFISFIVDVLESEKVGFNVKDVLIWQKSNPMPRNITRRYVQDMEFAIWAVKKSARWVFNKQENVPYQRSLFRTSVVNGNERTEHPTQKSLQLMKEIISIHTNKNQTILDPFMGSGSTGIAALELGRNFIGIEKEKKYFDIAQSRFKEILSDNN